MSVEATSAIFLESDLRDTVRFLLTAIADHCDEERLAYPSIGHLRGKMGVRSDDTVRARIWVAIDAGELEVAWYAGPGRAHLYWVKTGLAADAEAPERFKEALAVSAQKLASGRVQVPKRLQEAMDAASEVEQVDPPKIRESEDEIDPPNFRGEPPKLQGSDPLKSLGANRQEPSGTARAREAGPPDDGPRPDPGGGDVEDVRGVSVGIDGVAAFTKAADAIVARWGADWWASWLVGAEARPANGSHVPWLISCKTRFAATTVRQKAGEMFEDLLGSKVVFEAMAVPPPKAADGEKPEAGKGGRRKRQRGKRAA